MRSGRSVWHYLRSKTLQTHHFSCLIMNAICLISRRGDWKNFWTCKALLNVRRALNVALLQLNSRSELNACSALNCASPPFFLTKIKHFASFYSFFPCQSFLFYKKLVPLHRYITKYNWLFCKSAKTQRLLRRRHLIVKGYTCTAAFCVTFHPELT